MSNYFTDITDGLLDLSPELVEESAVYPDVLSYLKVARRQVYMPYNKKYPMYGNLCMYYTTSVDDTINMIKNPKNLFPMNRYRIYLYDQYYIGKVLNKRYRYNDLERQKEIFKRVKKETGLKPIRNMDMIQGRSQNGYYDISRYISIFYALTEGVQGLRYISLFWPFLDQIRLKISGVFDQKFVICDVTRFPIKKSLSENLKNPLYAIYYTLFKKHGELLKDIDLDFYFVNGPLVLKINPAMLSIEDINVLKREMTKLMRSVSTTKNLVDAVDETNIMKEEIKGQEQETLLNATTPNTTAGDNVDIANVDTTTPDTKALDTEIKRKVSDVVDNIKVPDMDKFADATTPSDGKLLNATAQTKLPVDKDAVKRNVDKIAKEELNKDRELIEKIYRQSVQKEVQKFSASTARDERLRKEQENLVVKDMTIKDIEKIVASKTVIPETDISKSLPDVLNENMKTVRFNNFEKEYNRVLMKKDIVDAILSLNNKSIPVYVLNIDVKDSSDELNYKDTYTIKLEDANRKRHTITVDIPKFIDDRFIYLGGNKKIIKYQNFFYPIVKIKPDTVLVVSNYNKMTIERVETKSVSYVERIMMLIRKHPELSDNFRFGNVSSANHNYITTIEYDEISKAIISYKKNDKNMLFFDQGDAQSYAMNNKITIPDGKMFIGVDEGKPVLIDINTQKDAKGKSIIERVISLLPDELREEYAKIRPPKRLMYAKVTVMEKAVSIGLLCGLWEGITKILNRLKVNYTLEEKIPKELRPDQAFIRFNDCVLVYDETISNALVLNGFRLIETSKYSFADFDTKEPYIQYIIKIYGKAQIENALYNVYEFMIDPITKSILEDLSQPTELVGVLIYACELLSDSQYTNEISQNINRIRSNEIIPAMLYSAIAKGYITYRNSNGRKKISVKKDCVLTELLSQKTVEDYSVLNPNTELIQSSAISTKGYKGINLDDAYTIPKRAYDDTMVGTIAPVTPPDGGCGVTRYLTTEPPVMNLRGYVKAQDKEDIKKLKDVNVFTPAEMLTPLAVTHDDPNRLGHMVKQAGHVVPVEDASPVLITNGLEERARFTLTSDFVINADEAGEIIDYNEETKIMVAKYKSGKCRAFSLAPAMAKNGGGGFWIANQMETSLKVGDKFKKGDVLAWHKNFFTNSKYNPGAMNTGVLTKVALTSGYNTYEDATFITKNLSERCATDMVYLKTAVIGKNSNVSYLAKEGDYVEVGDLLAQFDTSFEDDSVNKLLAVLGDEDREDILANSKNEIRSKLTGEIVCVKIYSTVDLDELSPSLRKIVNKQYNKVKKTKAFLAKYESPDDANPLVHCGMLYNESTSKVKPNKYGVVKGEKAEDSVLIEFYIKHHEPLEIGSKAVMFTALKNTIGEIIPEGYEPYSEYRKDEEIGTIIASNSILNRIVPSITLSALGNKCLIELKNKLREIYES